MATLPSADVKLRQVLDMYKHFGTRPGGAAYSELHGGRGESGLENDRHRGWDEAWRGAWLLRPRPKQLSDPD